MNSNSSLEIKNLDTLEVISANDLDKVVGGEKCPETFAAQDSIFVPDFEILDVDAPAESPV